MTVRRVALTLLVAAGIAGCAPPSTGTVGDIPRSSGVSRDLPAPSGSGPIASPAARDPGSGDVLEERTAGVTVRAGDPGGANLEGGRYRVAWDAQGCTVFELTWRSTRGGPARIPTVLPTGETFIELPRSTGTLDRVADCDYTVRFEAAE